MRTALLLAAFCGLFPATITAQTKTPLLAVERQGSRSHHADAAYPFRYGFLKWTARGFSDESKYMYTYSPVFAYCTEDRRYESSIANDARRTFELEATQRGYVLDPKPHLLGPYEARSEAEDDHDRYLARDRRGGSRVVETMYQWAAYSINCR
jgi:hypothetical protein